MPHRRSSPRAHPFALAAAASVLALGALGGLGVGRPAARPAPEIPWAKTWKAAVREATTRQVPILVFFLKDGQAESDAVREETLTDGRLVSYLDEVAVAVVAHTGDDLFVHNPDPIEDATGATIYRCPYYKTIECLHHIVLHSKVIQLLGANRYPSAYLLGSDGKPLQGEGRVDPMDPGGLVATLAQAQKKIGKPMRRSVYARAERLVTAGRIAFEAGKTKKAIQTLQAVEKDKKSPEPFRKEATDLLNEINQAGMSALREASRQLEQDREAGKKALRRIRAEYRGLEAGEKAKQSLIDAGKKGRTHRRSDR